MAFPCGVDARFDSKVELQENGCWTWAGYCDRLGYGRVSRDGRQGKLAHRHSYEVLVGPIPDGLDLDHLCRNPSCVNPAHLEPVTHQVNLARGVSYNGKKTHCKHGHEFTPENTRIKAGRRICRTCYNKRRREQRLLVA